MESHTHDEACGAFTAAFLRKDGALDLRNISWSGSVGSLASDGAFLKSTFPVDGDVYYLKLSAYDSYRGIFGHESVNELIACRLGELLGFRVARGILTDALVRIDGTVYRAPVFVSRSFKTTDSRASFEDFYISHRDTIRESPFAFSVRYGWKTDIFMMFIFDYLIINRDRHGGNLEVLKNDNLTLSPLFDHGLSFACTCYDDADIDRFDIAADRSVNNFVGERSLEKNLALIDTRLPFGRLKKTHRELLFADVGDLLSPSHKDKIWEIITTRWKNVEKFRLT